MGLFRRESPARKKLKELTGGFILSTSFLALLEENNLKTEKGIEIQRQLKDEIKDGQIDETNVEERLFELIRIHKNESSGEKTCPGCGHVQDDSYEYCINCGYEFNLAITCPGCGKVQDPKSNFCIECGYDFSEDAAIQDIKNENIDRDNIRIHKMKVSFLYNQVFNTKICPVCGTKILKENAYCFNCGSNVIAGDTKTNANADDELSNLEKLYSNAIESRYAPSFKIAYVLYLDAFKNSLKFSDKTAKKYETSSEKLESQARDDGFVEAAPAISGAGGLTVNELKEILRENNLKVSGKKAELIERLSENLKEDELKKYFKSPNYQISETGIEFIKNNTYILYIFKNPDISAVFHPSDIVGIFDERSYECSEIYDKLIRYLKRVLDKKTKNSQWSDFKLYSNALSHVLEDNNDLNDALNIRFKTFIFDINNYSPNLGKSNPGKTKLKKKDISDLVKLIHRVSLPIDELKGLFEKSYDEVMFKTVITKKDSLIYLLKIISGENLDSISDEICESYSKSY